MVTGNTETLFCCLFPLFFSFTIHNHCSHILTVFFLFFLSPLSHLPPQVFAELSQIIEQCWHHNGEARLTALRVKKSLSNIYSELAAKPIELRQPDNQIQVSL